MTSRGIPAESPFLKRDCSREGTVERSSPDAPVPKTPHHPLFIAENFAGNACVGIASRNYEKLFKNNDVSALPS